MRESGSTTPDASSRNSQCPRCSACRWCEESSSAGSEPWSRRSCGATRSRAAGRRTEKSPDRLALAKASAALPGGSELVDALEGERLQVLGGRAVGVDEDRVIRPVPAQLPAQLD